jgi:SAM-dependent methyltransferase
MSKSRDLLEQKSHFAFGSNWASYAKLVTDSQIDEAVSSLKRLTGGDLAGKRMLDIGCGSGLHALAALRLGAREVVAVDIDADSVATTRQLLQAHAADEHWSVQEASVFALQADALGRFDVVYSWGVLHHTGDLYRAMSAAAALVLPAGQFIFALYRRTRLCWAWKIEKRWYAGAGKAGQSWMQAVYIRLFRLAMRRDFDSYVANYGRIRGMDFYHDVHDWLGGWPYESISPQEVDRLMRSIGMREVRSFVHPRKELGLFGSGCDEFVYERIVTP